MGKRLGIDTQDVAVGKDVGAGRLHGGCAQAAAPVRLGDVVAELGGAPVDVRPARGAYAAHALAALRYGKGEDAPRLRGQHGRDELARVILGIGGGQPVAQVVQYMGLSRNLARAGASPGCQGRIIFSMLSPPYAFTAYLTSKPGCPSSLNGKFTG